MTWPLPSSGTKPCCWPETPMPRTRLPSTWRATSLRTVSSAAAHSCGCCSMCPTGSPAMRVCGARASATTRRVFRSRTTALTLWVPESMPMKRDMGYAGHGRKKAHGAQAGKRLRASTEPRRAHLNLVQAQRRIRDQALPDRHNLELGNALRKFERYLLADFSIHERLRDR